MRSSASGIEYPVLIDSELEVWEDYGNQGWPASYLFDGRARLFEYHYGEGAYEETELAIQELLGSRTRATRAAAPRGRPRREAPDPQTADQPRAYSGPYEAGGVWAVFDGTGTVRVNLRDIAVESMSEPLIEQSATRWLTHRPRPGRLSTVSHVLHARACSSSRSARAWSATRHALPGAWPDPAPPPPC